MNNEYMSAGVVEPAAEAEKPQPDGAERAGRPAPELPPDRVENKSQGPPRTVWREYFESLVVTAIMALFGMTFVVQAVKVPTGSMQNTILIGDHLLVNKFIFAPGETLPFLPQRPIRRGDIIVFKYPGNKENPERDLSDPSSTPYTTNFVKRVVGLPGDRIEVRGERVFINGQELPENRVTAVNPEDDLGTFDRKEDDGPLEIQNDPPPSNGGSYTVYNSPQTRRLKGGAELRGYPSFRVGAPVTIPVDSYFVMGDNRNNSLDSREWGFVPRDLVIGRAMFVYWSYDQSAPSSGNFIVDFVRNSRWSRTGALVR